MSGLVSSETPISSVVFGVRVCFEVASNARTLGVSTSGVTLLLLLLSGGLIGLCKLAVIIPGSISSSAGPTSRSNFRRLLIGRSGGSIVSDAELLRNHQKKGVVMLEEVTTEVVEVDVQSC